MSKSDREGQESHSYQYEQDQNCDGDECSSRAKAKVASRELVSNVEWEDTRLTDAGRKERVKEEKEPGRKEKEDPKERSDKKENGQILVTRGRIPGTRLNWHGKAYGLEVDPVAAVDPVPDLTVR